MLKACPYCGRIHDTRFDCGQRPARRKNGGRVDAFRGSNAWKIKRDAIRSRDLNLCRVCLAAGRLQCSGLSVHHIEPLEEAWALRLEDDNLLTVCGRCHEQAEAGQIPREKLHTLARCAPQLIPPASTPAKIQAPAPPTGHLQK